MSVEQMRVAAIQMNSGADVEHNLQVAGALLDAAAQDGCKLAVLPENFALMPERGRDKVKHAETPANGPIQAFLAECSQRNGIWIIGGSMPLESPELDAGRVFGACPVYDSSGTQRAIYRKIHLFDVDLADASQSYRESRSMFPGDDVVSVDTPAGRIGLSICYDLRFPELYRRLIEAGACLFTVPAAFTVPTGEAHWHTLLRARAIENLAYVVAAGQYGEHPDRRSTYGHSLIIDPWGRILAEQAAGDGFIAADIDLAQQQKLRNDFPALRNRRL